MKTIKKQAFKLSPLAFAVVAAVSTPVFASEVSDKGVTASLMGGHHTHDKQDQSLDSSSTMSVGLGYQFASPWDVELTYLTSEPENLYSGASIDEEHLRLDALYFFDREGKVRPYAVVGGGEATYDSGAGKFDTTILNAGAGLKYLMNERVSLRSDVRAISYEENGTVEGAINLGLSFFMGKSKPKKKAYVAPKKPSDTDFDGIEDSVDQCRSTPMNTPVDAYGCAVTIDSDGDGVEDKFDKCPGSEIGAKVTKDGCYQELEETKTITLRLQFATNTANVLNPNDPQLMALSQFMKQYPSTDVVLEGYTDSRGSEAYNLKLSQKRSRAVGEILASRYGVARNRIRTVGYGETNPVASNETASGRSQNRRVEAKISTTVRSIVK